jgi:molybdate transport system substrate-binding protein
MKRRLALGAGLLLASVSAAPAAAELLVSAAASLADVMPEIGKAWEARGGEKLIFNFASSSALVSQIEAGAPVDLLFTADEETMKRLTRSPGRIVGTPRMVVGNRLAVVVPKDRTFVVKDAADLAGREVGRLALADPTAVPAGKYAKAWLEKRGVWAEVEKRVVPTLNVRAALAAVAAGEADAAVVYTTDVRALAGVQLAFAVPEAEGPRIVYPAAVVTSKRSADATKLLDFLASPEAAAIFERFGFVPVATAKPTP